jgi:hypothetical protein
LLLFAALAAGTAGLDFDARAQRLVALEFLQRGAHVREAVGEEESGREEEREK